MQIEEHRAAAQRVFRPSQYVRADCLEQRMSRRDPFQSGLVREQRLVKHHFAIFAAEPPEAAFLEVANLQQVPGHFANPVHRAR